MSTTTYSYSKDVLDFQIMEEATRGTFSTGVATSLFVAQSPQLSFGSDLGLVVNQVLGSDDPAHVLNTMHTYMFSLMIPNVVQPETLNFLKRGISLAVGTGTIAYTFSGCLRLTIGGSAYYLQLRNCVIDSGVLGCVGGGPLMAQVNIAGNLSAFNMVAPVGWTFAAVPATEPLMGTGGGASPVRIWETAGSFATAPISCRSWVIGWSRGVTPIPNVGIDTWADFIPTQRRLAVSFTCNEKDVNLWTLHNNHTEVSSQIIIQTAATAAYFNLVGGKVSPYMLPLANTDPLIESYTHLGLVGTLTNT